jgi:L-fuculose-phosphate aldolase
MQTREAIVAAGARLAAHGLIVGGEGNLSVRLGSDRLLITPTGRRKDELVEDGLVIVALDPTAAPRNDPDPAAPRPSSDLAIHRAIYFYRPDVQAIVHAHVPAAMALTLAGEAPDPTVLPETAYHLPIVPVVPFGRMGSDELAARVAATFAGTHDGTRPDAVLLERHGAITVGVTLESAVDRMDLVDVLCRTWRDARLLAPDRRLAPPREPGEG